MNLERAADDSRRGKSALKEKDFRFCHRANMYSKTWDVISNIVFAFTAGTLGFEGSSGRNNPHREGRKVS